MLIFSLSYGKLSVHSSSIKYSLLSFPPHRELYTIHSIIISWMEVCFSCIPGHRNQYICGCVCTLMHMYLCVCGCIYGCVCNVISICADPHYTSLMQNQMVTLLQAMNKKIKVSQVTGHSHGMSGLISRLGSFVICFWTTSSFVLGH